MRQLENLSDWAISSRSTMGVVGIVVGSETRAPSPNGNVLHELPATMRMVDDIVRPIDESGRSKDKEPCEINRLQVFARQGRCALGMYLYLLGIWLTL